MASYYNTSKAPISIPLGKAATASVSGKHWIEIAPEFESSAVVLDLVRQGILVRSRVQPTKQQEPVAKVEAKVEAPAKVEATQAKQDEPVITGIKRKGR